MSAVFLITGCGYSGWDRVARLLVDGDQLDGLLNNAVTRLKLGSRSPFPVESAKKALSELPINGWADEKSHAFLNEWSELEALSAVLVYRSPEQVFAEVVKQTDGDIVAANEALEEWRASAQKMLNYFQNNRDSALLVHADAVVDQTEEFKKLFHQLTGNNLSEEVAAEAAIPEEVIEAQATQLIDDYEVLHSVYENLQSAASLPGPDIVLAGFASQRGRALAEAGLGRYLKEAKQLSHLDIEVESLKAGLIEKETKLEALSEENELIALQIFQLQEELESLSQDAETKRTKLNSEIESLKASLAEKEEKLEALSEEKELSVLQISQLQEELESFYQKIKDQEARLVSAHTELDELRQQSEQEQELYTLQIFQLQEELEHYYLKYEELSNKAVIPDHCLANPRAAEHSLVAGCEIMGNYTGDGYEDISLRLHQLILSDGRQYERLSCKLVKKAGVLGLEIREKDNSGDLLSWPDGMADDHGRFLLFIPSPAPEQREPQLILREHLNTSDRQLIEAVINVLSDSFIVGRLGNLELYPGLPLKHWRLAATELARQLAEQPKFLSVDTVKINEDYSADGYKHLWLDCAQVQVDKRVIKRFDFKLASVTTKKKGSFAEQLILELREQLDGEAPLEAWPPEDSDEYGPKMLLSINSNGDKTYIDTAEALTPSDELFITCLIKKLPTLLGELEREGEPVSPYWHECRNRLVEINDSTFRFGAKLNVLKKAKHVMKRVYSR